jgi:uncharacterized protein
MDITPRTPKGKLTINRYGDGGFVVNDVPYKGSILILSDCVLPWPVSSFGAITPASFTPLFARDLPEMLLVGVGPTFKMLTPVVRGVFRDHNISADAMDTGAACRTYNVLLTEGRLVAAALIAV